MYYPTTSLPISTSQYNRFKGEIRMKQNTDSSQDILLSLRKFLAPEIVYGERALELAGQHTMNLGGTKILIVTDPGVQAAGWTAKVEDSLRQLDIASVTFADITTNPKDYEVMNGAELYREQECDLIIAVGGGSPMDCAKGIGVVVSNPDSILAFEGIDEVTNPGPPLIFIPTTAGTSADVSQFAIISDSKRKVKIAIISKMVIPDIALVDPKTTITMSPELTAATGMDALSHGFEALVSTASSPLTDMAALSSIELIFQNLVGAYRQPVNMTFRDNMMMASLMSGLAFSNASLGMVHAMAHGLGGSLGLAHGKCNAILLENVVRYNYPAAEEKYDRVLKMLEIDIGHMTPEQKASTLVERIATLRKQLAINQRLGEMGVTHSDISRLAAYAFKDPCLATNPRHAEPADIEQIYQQVYE
jgi:alcohol dehydrogenase class IV